MLNLINKVKPARQPGWSGRHRRRRMPESAVIEADYISNCAVVVIAKQEGTLGKPATLGNAPMDPT